MKNITRIIIGLTIAVLFCTSCNLAISLLEGFEDYEIQISPKNMHIEPNQGMHFTALKYHFSDNSIEDITSSVVWSIENDTIAAITEDGEVFAYAEGETAVYARFEKKAANTMLYIGFPPEQTPDNPVDPTLCPSENPTNEPTAEWTAVPTGDSTPETTPAPGALPPDIPDLGYTSNLRPVWTWCSGGNGIGIYQYKLDDADFGTGATQTTDLSFTPPADLSEGTHRLYIREYNADYIWSTTASAVVTIDFTSPLVNVGKDRTTGIAITAEADASDASGISSFFWHKVNGPGTVNFSNQTATNTTVDVSTDGWYTIGLDVHDVAGNTGYDQFTLVVDTTIAAFFPFNGNTNDESGNNRHASTVSGPPLVPDRNGHPDSAYDVDSSYIKLPHSSHPDIYSQFTIAGWVLRHESGTHAFQCFMGKDYSQSYGIGVQFSSQKFYIKIGGVVYSFDNPNDPSVPNNNTWHHFAVTYSDTGDNLELYYDGSLVRAMYCPATITEATGYDLCFGKDGKYTDSHQGKIDDIYMYNRVLNAAEIADIYVRP